MLRYLLLAPLLMTGPVHAGLFDDAEARQQVAQVSTRVASLEDADALRTKTLLDMQAQIENLKGELRMLRGQSEELVHGLQNGEKRQKDFYLDLDTRLRRLEPVDPANAVADAAPSGLSAEVDDIAVENRAYETARALVRANKHQEAVEALQAFLKKFPASVHAPGASYDLGQSYFALEDYTSALAAYRVVTTHFSFSPKAPDALLGIASSQQKLKAVDSAKKSLNQLVTKYPESEAAREAKMRLADSK